MPEHAAIDTTVLVNANKPLLVIDDDTSQLPGRYRLLRRIEGKEIVVLLSDSLLQEYIKQIKKPRNDFIKAFFELLSRRDFVQNWSPWTRDRRSMARDCEFPIEDDHVLRTALRPKKGKGKGYEKSAIYSEEKRMVDTNDCIYRAFRVHIRRP